MNAAKENIIEPIAKYVEENYGTPDSDGFQGDLVSIALDLDTFLDVLISDALWALGALVFVLVVFIFHLKSCFLGCIGITLIIFSFPLVIVICKAIL